MGRISLGLLLSWVALAWRVTESRRIVRYCKKDCRTFSRPVERVYNRHLCRSCLAAATLLLSTDAVISRRLNKRACSPSKASNLSNLRRLLRLGCFPKVSAFGPVKFKAFSCGRRCLCGPRFVRVRVLTMSPSLLHNGDRMARFHPSPPPQPRHVAIITAIITSSSEHVDVNPTRTYNPLNLYKLDWCRS